MNSPRKPRLGRRDFLKTAAATSLASALVRDGAAATPAARNPLIADENRRPGALDWQLTRVRLNKAQGIRAADIEGYCSKQSVLAGETLDFFVSTTPASRFKM